MRKQIPAALLLSLIVFSAFTLATFQARAEEAAASNTAGKEEQAAIRKCFSAYKAAILDGNGEVAVKHITAGSLAKYEKLKGLALYAKRADVNSHSLMDKLIIFSLRHRVPLQSLDKMTPQDLFVYAVNHGWMGRDSVMDMDVGDISIAGLSAEAARLRSGKRINGNFLFENQEKQWRLDLTVIMSDANGNLGRIVENSKTEENQFLFNSLESITGTEVTEEIWQPLAKSGS